MADIRTTPQLDNFFGSNEDPLSHGGLWAQLDATGAPHQLQRLNNAGRGKVAFPQLFWASYWTPSTFTGDIQMWGALDEALSNTDWCGQGMLTNLGGSGNVPNGYIAYTVNSGGASRSEIYRYDASWNGTLLNATADQANYSHKNTLFLFQTVGTHLEYYYSNDGGATWTQLDDIVDNTYRTSLYLNISLVGMIGNETGWISFGGGTPGAFTTQPQLMRY